MGCLYMEFRNYWYKVVSVCMSFFFFNSLEKYIGNISIASLKNHVPPLIFLLFPHHFWTAPIFVRFSFLLSQSKDQQLLLLVRCCGDGKKEPRLALPFFRYSPSPFSCLKVKKEEGSSSRRSRHIIMCLTELEKRRRETSFVRCERVDKKAPAAAPLYPFKLLSRWEEKKGENI